MLRGQLPDSEVFGSPDQWSCMDSSPAPGTPPKRHGNLIFEAGVEDSYNRAASGSPGASKRCMVEQRGRQGREQRRKDRNRKRQGKEIKGEAEKGLKPRSNLLENYEGQHPEFAGHLNPLEARTSQVYSSTVGTGVEIPVSSGDGRGESPEYEDDKPMTTGGAILKELTPIATRPGRPYGGTTNNAECGTGRWSLKRDQVDDHSHLMLRSFFP